MGRDLVWYVLPKHMTHDKNKKICLDSEFQEDKELMISQLYEKITNESGDFDYKKIENETMTEYFTRKEKFQKQVQNVVYDYMHKDIHRGEWCPKCHMFVCGIYSSELIIKSKDIRHSYSNPIWSSKWNIKSLYLGSSDTNFTNLFSSDNMYRQIEYSDVQYALRTINELGEPLRNSDKEAHEETMEILSFLGTWTQKDDVIVIMEDEY
jgi:hypothetical protein